MCPAVLNKTKHASPVNKVAQQLEMTHCSIFSAKSVSKVCFCVLALRCVQCMMLAGTLVTCGAFFRKLKVKHDSSIWMIRMHSTRSTFLLVYAPQKKKKKLHLFACLQTYSKISASFINLDSNNFSLTCFALDFCLSLPVSFIPTNTHTSHFLAPLLHLRFSLLSVMSLFTPHCPVKQKCAT